MTEALAAGPVIADPGNLRSHSRLATITFLALMSVLGALGFVMAVLGMRIMILGGTVYYLAAGAVFAAAAVLAWLKRDGAALIAVGAGIALTAGWSLFEIVGKGWQPSWLIDLAGRIGLLAALAALVAAAWVFMKFPAGDLLRKAVVGAAVLGLAAIGVLLALMWERPQAAARPFVPATSANGPDASRDADADWTAFGGTTLERRHSRLDQINSGNVKRMVKVWEFQSDDTPPNDRVFFSSQNTPTKVGDLLYTCTPGNQVAALDPASGDVVWRYDPKVPARAMESLFSVACRSVGYHALPEAPAPTPRRTDMPSRFGSSCTKRIYVATADGRLIALDALAGYVCRSFGNNGVVDLTAHMGLTETGFASNTSGPTVAGGLLLVGQQVSDNQRRDAPSGVVRAFDAVTGELRWAWDALRPDPQALPGPDEIFPRGTPNVWNNITADEELGLAFLGTGNAGADHWGASRTAEEDAATAAIIAVDLQTGRQRWAFQTVRHDLWDYDIGAPPTVVEVPINGTVRKAILQGTKSGDLYLLDALTGEPLRPVELRPAPQGAIAGERLEPAQPTSRFFPNHGGRPGREPERIDSRHAFGLTPIDAALCRMEFHQMRYEGLYTPPSLEGLGMLLFPGTIGGLNWGGISYDPQSRLIITNNSRMANRITLHPRDQVSDVPVGSGGARPDQTIAPHWGTPFGVDRPIWLSVLGVPCNTPPWGFMSATNLDTGELVWSQPLGTGMDTGPLGIPMHLRLPLGTANIGGPLTTAGGITFIAAAQDNYLRAFETHSGRLLWSHRLPAGGQATPMTYLHQGRQYVAIAATGHARLETEIGDWLVVFALED